MHDQLYKSRKKSHLLKNYYSSKIEKEPYRFMNHGH